MRLCSDAQWIWTVSELSWMGYGRDLLLYGREHLPFFKLLTGIQLRGMSRVMGEVLEQSDIRQREVTSKQRHHFHMDSVSGLGSHRHGDDTTALPAYSPVAAVVHN